jgi:hypothetical protein
VERSIIASPGMTLTKLMAMKKIWCKEKWFCDRRAELDEAEKSVLGPLSPVAPPSATVSIASYMTSFLTSDEEDKAPAKNEAHLHQQAGLRTLSRRGAKQDAVSRHHGRSLPVTAPGLIDPGPGPRVRDTWATHPERPARGEGRDAAQVPPVPSTLFHPAVRPFIPV